MLIVMLMCHVKGPSTLKDTSKSPNAKEWQEVADLEYELQLENVTWDLLDLSKDREVIGFRWVFYFKQQSDRQVKKYK